MIARLEQAGFGAWITLAKLSETRELLAGVLGEQRVLVGCERFNTVGHAAGNPNQPVNKIW